LKKSKIKELPVPVISKTIEELAVFIKEPVKNQWFYGPVLVYKLGL
jgi:hypothetical protein